MRLFLISLGSFWVAAALFFGRQMWRGDFRGVKKLHQDLASEAPEAVWWAKNLGLGAIGLCFLGAAWLPALLPAAGAAIALEQLAMPLLAPRHWKAYSGALFGLALGWWIGGGEVLVVGARMVGAMFAGGLCLVAFLPALTREQLLRAEAVMPRLARVLALSLAALIAWQMPHVAAPLWVAVAALALVFAISLLVNVPINRKPVIEGADRRRWDVAHLVRTGAGVVLLLALLS